MCTSINQLYHSKICQCNPRGSRSQCAYGDDAWSPVLQEAIRANLHEALQVFGEATKSGLNFQSAAAQGLADFKARERTRREAEEHRRHEEEHDPCKNF
jgi:hypothetical protein